MSESLVTLNGLKAYDVKKGTAVVDVDALPETVENRSYRVVGDTELETQAFIKDTEVATKSYVDNITVDGRTAETGTQNYISNAVLDVTELPDTVDNKVYRATSTDTNTTTFTFSWQTEGSELVALGFEEDNNTYTWPETADSTVITFQEAGDSTATVYTLTINELYYNPNTGNWMVAIPTEQGGPQFYFTSWTSSGDYTFTITETNNEIQGVYAKDTELATKDYVDDTYIPIAEKAEPNGVATLDANGHVPVGQMPTQALIYKGSWDASSGAFPTGEDFILGDFYIVSVEGTIDEVIYRAGDWIIWDGTQWTLSRNTNAVASVNEMTGAVMLYADILPVADDDNTNTKDYIDAITVDGNSQSSQNIVSKAVLEVDELPATPLNKVYNVTTASGTEVYSKGVKLVTDSSSVKSVNEQTPDANGDITIDGDTINATYEEETDTLNTILTKVGKVKTVDGVEPDTDGNIQSIAVEEVDALPETPENKVYVVDDGEGGYNIYAKDILIKNGEYVPLVDEMPESPSTGDVVCWNGIEETNTVYLKTVDADSVTRLCDASGNIITETPSGTLTSEVATSTGMSEDEWSYSLAYSTDYSDKIIIEAESPNGNWYYDGLVCDFENLTWTYGDRLGSSTNTDTNMSSASFVTYTVNSGAPYTKGHLYKYNGSTWDDVYTNTSTTADITEANALTNIGTSAGATQQTVNSAIDTAIGNKQDTLTAGTNITIADNVISASGGVAASVSGSTLYLTW